MLLFDRAATADQQLSIERVRKVTPDGARKAIFQLPDHDRLEICAVAAIADPRRFILDISAPSLGRVRDGNCPAPVAQGADAAYDRIYLLTTGS
jgi:hypothetical protein